MEVIYIDCLYNQFCMYILLAIENIYNIIQHFAVFC